MVPGQTPEMEGTKTATFAMAPRLHLSWGFMKASLRGLLVGCAICIVLWPLMYAASVNPRAIWSAPVSDASTILWPTSLLLMAVQPGSTILFRAYVTGLSVFANGLLYAVIAGLGYLALRFRSRDRGRGSRALDGH